VTHLNFGGLNYISGMPEVHKSDVRPDWSGRDHTLQIWFLFLKYDALFHLTSFSICLTQLILVYCYSCAWRYGGFLCTNRDLFTEGDAWNIQQVWTGQL